MTDSGSMSPRRLSKRLNTYWLVASRAFLYFVQTRGNGDQWDWLYRRVRNPNSKDYKNKALVWALLSLAWKERKHIRVVAIYRDFEEIITETWDQKWRERILATIDDAESVLDGNPEQESERDFVIHRDYRPRR